MMRREKEKLERTLGGIRTMAKVPSAVWVVDTKKEHLAIAEARKLNIPVVAILDTNCDPDEVDYPIPGNDDAIRAVGLLTRVVADAVAEGTIARHSGSGTAQADASEPLAEWETELLAGEAAAEAAVAEVAADAAADIAVEAEVEAEAAVVAAVEAEVVAEKAAEVAEEAEVVAEATETGAENAQA